MSFSIGYIYVTISIAQKSLYWAKGEARHDGIDM